MAELQENTQEQALRGPGGHFKRGSSGNPKGRPKGTRNRVAGAALDLLDGASDAIVGKLIAMAKEGQPLALKLAIERIVPRRDRSLDIDVPRLQDAADIAAAAARVIELAACGQVTLAEAREFLALLNVQRQTLETADLAIRLEALEQDQKERGQL